MSKSDPPFDVLVLGEHPSAYLAAALLRQKSTKLRVGHCRIPGEQLPERLVLVNPAFFELHSLLEPLKRTLDLTANHGLKFVADEPGTESEFRSKSVATWIGSYAQVRDALASVATAEGVELLGSSSLELEPPDEKGVTVHLGTRSLRATVLVVAGTLPAAQQKLLGMPDEWERDIVRRYSFVLLDDGGRAFDLPAKPTLPMSLDLNGQLVWAWLLSDGEQVQLAVSQSFGSLESTDPVELLRRWARVLHDHAILDRDLVIREDQLRSIDLPLAGALAHEGVGDRALLVGPAGGFFSASAEDIYPNCWSAVFAAEVIKKALKEPHLQDALHPYRQNWRTTLGDYLRGPQHNLRFLLPLVYKNPAMTTRLAESILRGKSVVR